MKFNCPYCDNPYSSNQGLATHLGICKNSTGEYVVSRVLGLLHYSVFADRTTEDIIKKYPDLTPQIIRSFIKTFNKRGINIQIKPCKTYVYYKCPYCGAYSKKSGVLFKNWYSVARHATQCINSTNKYYFNNVYGPIDIEFFNKHSSPYINTIYPDLQISPKHIRTTTDKNYSEWKIEELIEKANYFYEVEGRFPITKDFENNSFYPSVGVIYNFFSSWEDYLVAAGIPYTNNSYGIPTVALDGHKYRSVLEAVFVNKFLFGKYSYNIEPKYPDKSWLYDWYVKDLDLYIELAGGLRSDRITEKIK